MSSGWPRCSHRRRTASRSSSTRRARSMGCSPRSTPRWSRVPRSWRSDLRRCALRASAWDRPRMSARWMRRSRMPLTAERAETTFRRHHRLRRSAAVRRLFAETRLAPSSLLLPVFVDARIDEPTPIASLPGHSRWPASRVAEVAERATDAGIGGLLLFGLPSEKDDRGLVAADPLGPVPSALRALRVTHPDVTLVADVCLCEYTTHGHCGVLNADGSIDNDATLPLLADAAVTYARAGADVVAPSDMMDGRVGAIRAGLDAASLAETPI